MSGSFRGLDEAVMCRAATPRRAGYCCADGLADRGGGCLEAPRPLVMRGPDASCLCLGVSSLTGPSTALVAGAGIVGLCCALSLQRAGLKVTLIDRAAPGEACSLGNSGSFGVGLVAPHAMPGIGRRIPRLWLRPDEPLSLGSSLSCRFETRIRAANHRAPVCPAIARPAGLG